MNRKQNELIRNMVEIAAMAALAFVLDFVQGLLPKIGIAGGSIGIAMLPIMFISLRRGAIQGLVTGLIVSCLQLIGTSMYIIPGDLAIIQVALDYFLAYTLVGLTGLFTPWFKNVTSSKDKVIVASVACIIGGLAKFMAHFLSGVIFWANNEYVGGPIVYSIIYNGSYMLPNIIICTGIMMALVVKQPKIFVIEE